MISYLFLMNTFLFFRYGIRMLYFLFFLIYSKSTNIENRVQIQPILYSSQSIRLQIFFRVSDNRTNIYKKMMNLLSIVSDIHGTNFLQITFFKVYIANFITLLESHLKKKSALKCQQKIWY